MTRPAWIAVAAVVAVVVVVLLFQVVFPWLDRTLFANPVLGAG